MDRPHGLDQPLADQRVAVEAVLAQPKLRAERGERLHGAEVPPDLGEDVSLAHVPSPFFPPSQRRVPMTTR